MNRWFPVVALSLLAALSASNAHSFCGFYVARGDAKLFNKASKVVLARDDDRTVLTMSSDFKGEPSEFALVVPVPVVLKKSQIHVGDQAAVDHLDAYTAPRLVEYFDPDPCVVAMERKASLRSDVGAAAPSAQREEDRARSLGVTIEARYTVGEYDILILSAKQSGGLATWLTENGYKVPPGAASVIRGYLLQGMRFFVAKVNLKEKKRLGFSYLRPLQIAFESPKFMLPIRLGMVNADGPQELFVFALTRTGRIETTNYRTVRLPTDAEIPVFVKEEFGDFYRAMFARQVRRQAGEAVFLEYAWDMAWCDPCASDPLSREELRGLGVFWLGGPEGDEAAPQGAPGRAPRWMPPGGGAENVFVTRLHVRYDARHFPEDLAFQETGDRTNFQGRFVVRHPWAGDRDCPGAADYRRALRKRQAKEAETLADLTGWDLETIRRKMRWDENGGGEDDPERPRSWWEKMWGSR
ncbi:MAG TPA: DUF2330 domain-containing protein [Candidatus Eisenbacteria bacterium]|nr:DUF2330 domain-containing protein [Candidatus Eisenbacteria bacterium]